MSIDYASTDNGAYAIVLDQDDYDKNPDNQNILSLPHDIEIMLKNFADRPDLTVAKMMREPELFNRALKLCEMAQENDYSSNQFLSLKIRILDCLTGGLRDFDKAKDYIADIEQLFSKGMTVETRDQALYKVNKGFFEGVYHVDLETAAQFMNEGAALWHQLDGYHEEKFRTIINLVQYKLLKGYNAEANELIRQGFDCWDKVEAKPYKVIFLYAYSLLLNDEGKVNEALSIIEQASSLLPETKDYPTNELFILSQRADLLIKLKRYDQAQVYWQEAYTKIKSFFKDKPNTSMARILLLQGILEANDRQNFVLGEQLIQKSIAMFDQAFHDKDRHRIQASSHLALGQVLEQQNKYDEALVEYLISEHIYQKLMDHMNIEGVSILYYHLVNVNKALHDETAAQIYLQKHHDLFGDQHPRSLKLKESF